MSRFLFFPFSFFPSVLSFWFAGANTSRVTGKYSLLQWVQRISLWAMASSTGPNRALAELSRYSSHSQCSGYNLQALASVSLLSQPKPSCEPHSTQTYTSEEAGDLAFHDQGCRSGPNPTNKSALLWLRSSSSSEVIQSIKCLLCKRKDSSMIPRSHVRSLAW